MAKPHNKVRTGFKVSSARVKVCKPSQNSHTTTDGPISKGVQAPVKNPILHEAKRDASPLSDQKSLILKTVALTALITFPIAFAVSHGSLPPVPQISKGIDSFKELVFKISELIAYLLVWVYLIVRHLGDLGLITKNRDK